jgi:hypothetical protein
VKLKNQIPKNMGKLEDTKAVIEREVVMENNRIYTAYQCRDNPNILNAKHKSTQPKSSQNEEVEHTWEDVATIISFSNDNDDSVLPSKLLDHEEWLKRMHVLFGIDDMLGSFSVTNAIKAKGDYLVKILRGQMKQLLKKRIQNESKRAHWSFNLVSKNLSIVVAYMVMVDHVKTDLKCLDEYDSLLSHRMHKFMLSATYPKREGAYLL